MKLQTAANISQILALPLSAYCAYGVYENLHPTSGQEASMSSWSPVLWVAFGALGLCVVIIFINRLSAWKAETERKPPADDPKPNVNDMEEEGLVIHSALYGVDGDERDVTSVVRSTRRNAFAIAIDSTTFGCNPGLKSRSMNRLRVEYSYHGEYLTTEISDRSLLTLPEDRWTGKELRLLRSQVKGLQEEINKPQEESVVHSACIRPTTKRVFKVEKIEREPSQKAAFVDRLIVILTNNWESAIRVWGPMWKSERDEVRIDNTFVDCLAEAKRAWEDGVMFDGWFPCLTVESGHVFKVALDVQCLHEGLPVRLTKQKTGTLILPLRIGTEICYQKIDL